MAHMKVFRRIAELLRLRPRRKRHEPVATPLPDSELEAEELLNQVWMRKHLERISKNGLRRRPIM